MGLYSWAEVHNPQLPSVRKSDALKNVNWSLLQNLHWNSKEWVKLKCLSVGEDEQPIGTAFHSWWTSVLDDYSKADKGDKISPGRGGLSSTNQGETSFEAAIDLPTAHGTISGQRNHFIEWLGLEQVSKSIKFQPSNSILPLSPHAALTPLSSPNFPSHFWLVTQTWPLEQSSLSHVIPLS